MSRKASKNQLTKSQHIIREENIISTEANNAVKGLLQEYVVREMSNELQTQMNSIIKSLDSMKSSVEKNTSAVDRVDSVISDEEKGFASLVAALKAFGGKVIGIEKELPKVHSGVIAEISKFEKSVNEVADTQHNNLTTSLSTIETQIKTLHDDIYKTNCELLSSLSDSITKDIEALNELCVLIQSVLDNESKQVNNLSETSNQQVELLCSMNEHFESLKSDLVLLNEKTVELTGSISEIINQVVTEIKSGYEQKAKKDTSLLNISLSLCAVNFLGILTLIILQFFG